MGRPKKNVVQLSDAEVKRFYALRKKQGISQTIANRCNILLAVDEHHLPAKTYDQRMVSCGVSCAAIALTIRMYAEKGPDETFTLKRNPNSDNARWKVDGRVEAKIVQA